MANHFRRPRQSRFRIPLSLLALLPVFLTGGALQGQEVLSYLETGVGRKQADFGTPVQNTLWLGYATYGAAGSRWNANLTVPFLRQDQEEGGATSQEQGLGDITVQGAYRFLTETEDGWSLDGIGALKLPTASDTKGLGTGRTDVGGFLALHQQLGLFQWTVLAGWIQGSSSSPTQSTDNPTSGAYVIGLSGSWYLDHNRWSLSLEARGATDQGLPGAKEISVDVFHPFSSNWGMKAAFTAGLNDGGPRQSVGLAIVHLFK